MGYARRRKVLGAIFAVVIMGGCAEDVGESAPAAEEASLAVPSLQVGPLAQVLGVSATSQSARDLEAELAAHEEAVAACMKAQGFEYWPVAYRIERGGFDPVSALPGTPDYAHEYGYGIWRSEGEWTATPAEQSAEELAYLASLSPAMGRAYEEAMDGEIDEVFPDGSYSTTGGCQNVSTEPTAPQPDPAELDAREFLATIRTRSEFDGVNAEWSACMREQGYEYGSPSEAEAAMAAVFDAAMLAAGADGRPDPQAAIDGSAVEIATASADAECRVNTDWTERSRAIQVDLEQRYLDEHPELRP